MTKTPAWMDSILKLVFRGQKARALKRLDAIIEKEFPLFWGEPTVDRTRRMAWRLRIHFLMEWRRYGEALAWTCLECEFGGEDPWARAKKDSLMKGLRLGPGAGRKVFRLEGLGAGTWKGVHGMRAVKVQLEDEVVGPFADPDTYRKYKLKPCAGVLFYGPPGCGKTHLARGLARRIDIPFLEASPGELSTPYVHGAKGNLVRLFGKAASQAPCLLFLDEIDALAPHRDGRLDSTYAGEVTELLIQMEKAAKHGVLVVAATNRREVLDPALLRPGRFDLQVEIGPPDLEARAEFFRADLSGRPAEEKLDSLIPAQATDGATFSQIRRIVEVAARRALRAKAPIAQTHLAGAIGEVLYGKKSARS